MQKVKILLTKTESGYYIIAKLVNAITVEVRSCGRCDVGVGETLKAVEAHELVSNRRYEVTVIPAKKA